MPGGGAECGTTFDWGRGRGRQAALERRGVGNSGDGENTQICKSLSCSTEWIGCTQCQLEGLVFWTHFTILSSTNLNTEKLRGGGKFLHKRKRCLTSANVQVGGAGRVNLVNTSTLCDGAWHSALIQHHLVNYMWARTMETFYIKSQL